MIKSKTLFFVILLIGTNHFSKAQSSTKEFGLISNASFSSAGIVFKKQTGEDKYFRLGLRDISFSHVYNTSSADSRVNVSLIMGLEKRKQIADKIQFIRGLNGGVDHVSAREVKLLRISLGYWLGFQYNLSESFYVSTEMRSSVNTTFDFSRVNDFKSIRARLLDNGLNFTLAYRFK